MLAFCAVAWTLLCAWTFWYCRRPRVASLGIPLAYVASLSLIHWGAFVYLLPWYDPTRDPYLAASGVTAEQVTNGLFASTLGLAFFCLGVWLFDQLPGAPARVLGALPMPDEKTGRNLVVIGAVSYFVVSRTAGWLPGGANLSGVGSNLALVGVCLMSLSWRRRRLGSKAMVVLIALSFPAITVISSGFLGFGVTALIQVGAFFAMFARWRWWSVPVAAIALWAGLSVYVAYMDARTEIRDVVWRGREGGGFGSRVDVVARTLSAVRPFDPWDLHQLHLIDGRMNQNSLVGRAIHYMKWGGKEPARGRTLLLAAVAWIPRILWPGKPAFGGSGRLVSEFTGRTFSDGTAIGVGNVMELYINFGYSGISIGFLLFGAFLRYLDRRAATALELGDHWGYVFFHLVGICALHPIGMWAEVVGACSAAAIVVTALRRVGVQP